MRGGGMSIATIKALVDQLAYMDVTPLHLNIDGPTPTETRPNIRLWLRTRSEFEAVCKALSLPVKESRYDPSGQRSWSASGDDASQRLFVSVVSFEHHDDWQPKPGRSAA
jgi:hypothetical protein